MINVLFPLSLISQLKIGDTSVPILSLSVQDKTILQMAFDKFSTIKDTNFYAVIGIDENAKIIGSLLPSNVNRIIVPGQTCGAACTCLYAIDEIDHSTPLLVSSLDQIVDMDLNKAIENFVNENADAGSIVFHSAEGKYSYSQIKDGRIVRTAEKKAICDIAMIGVYYFSTAGVLFHYVQNLLRKQVTQYDDGYFISGVLNEMILDGQKVLPYEDTALRYHKIHDGQDYNALLKSHALPEVICGNSLSDIDVHKLEDFVRGWVVGNFNPSVLKTNDVEFAVQNLSKDTVEEVHYHKIATEVTVIVSGKAKMQGRIVEAGDVVVVSPYEETGFEALEDTTTAVLKIPGANNDKYIKDSQC